MTEVAELVAVSLPPPSDDEELLCPFCKKEPVGHIKNDSKETDDTVESIPKNLGCENSDSWGGSGLPVRRKTGDLPYTIAKHHLISAMQCYAQIKRLVRMGNLAGYDINNENNGIGLPTTHWSLQYPDDNGDPQKYGDLAEPEGKKKVANALMKELGAQWHVGHHSFAIVVPKKDADSWKKDGSDEKSDEDFPHETGYDVQVVKRLLQLLKSFPESFCEEEDRNDQFKKSMDDISAEIKGKLEKFNEKSGAKPADSSPFFVSMRAYEFSGIADKLPNADKPVKNTTRGRE